MSSQVDARDRDTGAPAGARSVADDPKYVTICKDLRGRIASGEYRAGQRLPSQQQLARSYGVTIMTLRQALADLAAEGLVATEHGRGTFVSARPFEYRLNHLSSFAQDMRQQGKVVTTRVLFAGPMVEANDAICAQLAISSDERPFRLDRLRFVDGRPLVLQRSHLPMQVGLRLDSRRLETESLYEMLRALDLGVVRAVEVVAAVVLPAEEAELLDRRRGAAAFLSTRLSLTQRDRPVLFDRAYIVGDAVEISADRVADALRLSFRAR